MEARKTYATGDWIVHAHYGIGKIVGIEVKRISGEETSYFRIEATNSTFWMPMDQMDSEMSRPLSSQQEIQQAIDVLQQPPEEMSASHIERQGRIKRVRLENSPESSARLIRDLRAREREKGILSQNERSAYGMLKQQVVEEWTIVMKTESEQVASMLDSMLEQQR